ncbi:MAG TPA: hypothetical protein VNW06_06630 [Cytophagaceae bacterium]|jgi:hypothetical protein|nr:hypothetical protein [Cytophagaceae bacterium]
MIKLKKFVPAMLMVLFMLIVNYAMARAGGGGGSSSGGSGDEEGGILEILWYVVMFIPFPWNLAVGIVIAIAAFLIGKRMKAGKK